MTTRRAARFLARGLAATVLALSLTGCGDDDCDPPPIATPVPTATPVEPGPGPDAGVISLVPISADTYDGLATQAALRSASACQGDPFGGTVQVCQYLDASTSPPTWFAIGGNADADQPNDGAEAILFFGNDADGALAVAMQTVESSPNITGYWQAAWRMPPVTFQLGTTTELTAAFEIAQVQLTTVCSLPFGAATYTCAIENL
ncbi:MAG: hypothetical protein ACRERC_05525 [Candidatus Binatia bacterium]